MQTSDEVLIAEHGIGSEPRVKVFGRAKHFWQKEVEERPQLVKIVLQRGTGEEQAVLRLERAHNIRQLK